MDVLNDVKAPDFVGDFFSAPDEKLKSVVAWEYTAEYYSFGAYSFIEDLQNQRGAYPEDECQGSDCHIMEMYHFFSAKLASVALESSLRGAYSFQARPVRTPSIGAESI